MHLAVLLSMVKREKDPCTNSMAYSRLTYQRLIHLDKVQESLTITLHDYILFHPKMGFDDVQQC